VGLTGGTMGRWDEGTRGRGDDVTPRVVGSAVPQTAYTTKVLHAGWEPNMQYMDAEMKLPTRD
jgi:hypothetical protein